MNNPFHIALWVLAIGAFLVSAVGTFGSFGTNVSETAQAGITFTASLLFALALVAGLLVGALRQKRD